MVFGVIPDSVASHFNAELSQEQEPQIFEIDAPSIEPQVFEPEEDFAFDGEFNVTFSDDELDES